MKTKAEIIFEDLFKENYISLTCFAQKYINDLDASKEMVHLVFFNLWINRDEIDWQRCLKNYLFKSTYNMCLNYIRDNKKFDRNKKTMLHLEENLEMEIIDPMSVKEVDVLIKTSIAKLPCKCRKIFVLNRYCDMKYQEIAEKLNISVKTVEMHISKALKKIRRELKDYLL